MRKILFFIILSNICFAWVSANLNSQAEKCVNETNKREIQDFLCIAWSKERVAYQILLDERFNEIDEKIEEHIWKLEEQKWFYFWKNKSENYIDAVQNILNIYNTDWEFGKLYYSVCSWLSKEVIKELWDAVQIKNAAEFYSVESTTCTQLADQKLAIYKQVSYDILLLNKLQVSKDEKKTYVQQERTKYDGLLSKFMVNIWYVERIWAKWPSKTKNTSGW